MSPQEDEPADIYVRNTLSQDVEQITQMCRLVYRHTEPWRPHELLAHQRIFPEGQLVAIDPETNQVVGMAASLIVHWDAYELTDNWEDFTGNGTFETHDPTGRTLYGADVMVHPHFQGRGIGKKIYAARRNVVRRLGLLRIRAGARLRHYHRYAGKLSPVQYVGKVIRGEIGDPTLSFQLKEGFQVLAVVGSYLEDDPESKGYAAVIEWVNKEIAKPENYAGQERFFRLYKAELDAAM